MKMHDRAALRALLIHREVQEIFFARLRSRKKIPIPIQLGETGWIELSETGIRRSQDPTILQASTDVTAASGTQPAPVKTASEFHDALPDLLFGSHVHDPRKCHALTKNSSDPKFPDFRARAISLVPIEARVHGTPGSISGPIRKRSRPSFVTIAPAVSPPATISWVMPSSTNFEATDARNVSQR